MLIATGVSYRRLEARGLESLGVRGVYYGATASEASQCQGEDVYVVGAANSAGQAALNLAHYASKVVLVVRGARLEDTMSHYLVSRIAAADNIEVRLPDPGRQRPRRRPPRGPRAVRRPTGGVDEVRTSWLFVFIGASPRTDWLGPEVVRDDKGFLVTGRELMAADTARGGR